MQLAVNIAVLGSIYALISCGYVLIYRVSRVLSLAHGELMMLGAYGLYATASLFSAHPLVALAAACALGLMVGVAVYFALMWRMTGESVLAAVLATIALGILLRGAMILVFGTQTRHPLDELGWENASHELWGGARISTVGLALLACTALVYLGLFAFLRATRWGIRMRAAGQHALLAAQRGIGLHGVYALAWGLATLTGGLAGMLLAADAGLEGTLYIVGLKAFPAALVGGLDSLLGALAGSLIIAGAEVLLIHYVDPLLADVVPFIVLLAMLIVRPWGLFGTREELDRV
ncbi:MAG: branched-chain amino acid ABC transporter permease [Betaproteobacteria bacterium]|nr:branched-chain amino acid ABC transporter permease [Betaproteobacteria bacterium]